MGLNFCNGEKTHDFQPWKLTKLIAITGLKGLLNGVKSTSLNPIISQSKKYIILYLLPLRIWQLLSLAMLM